MRDRALIASVLAAGIVALGGIAGVAGAAFTHAGARSSSTFAAAAEFPPVVRQVPSILGAPQTGLALHATSGTFAPAASGATYTWLRCDAAGANCAATGATGADYTPSAADATKTLRVAMTPVNGSTPGAAVRSEPTAAVLPLLSGPSLYGSPATSTPAIGGTAAVGQALTATTGTWAQLLGSVLYAWQRCDAMGASCAPIAGATSASYTLTAADRGARISLRVTVTVLNLVNATAITETTAVVG